MGKKSTVTLNSFDNIYSYIESKSYTVKKYLDDKGPSKDYSLWIKTLTHSDIISPGKRCGPKQSIENNILYYLKFTEMLEIERQQQKPFRNAKQSNIGLPKAFFDEINIEKLQRRKGPQITQHEHKKLNEKNNIYLVNDSLTYFTNAYTKKIINKLNKNITWEYDDVLLWDGEFTEIEISQAIHGIGIQKDTNFYNLRTNLFVNDTIFFLIEKDVPKNNIFIFLERNPKFFTILGESNTLWEEYLVEEEKKRLSSVLISDTEKTFPVKEKSRKYQSVWKDMLAREMMVYSSHEGEVFCPFTYVSASYNNFSMLFIASHIKEYSVCSEKEAFDINNGLLLVSNADALFDKHLITISEEKKLIFSFLLNNNYELRNKLMLNEMVFELILNDKRMDYLKYHRMIFFKKEHIRRTKIH